MANRFKNPSDIQTKLTKEIVKQQQAAAEIPEAFALLKKEGFSEEVAKTLTASYPAEQVRKQIEWLSRRAPSRNRLGMLRRTIEENWPAPEELRHAEVSHESEFARHFYAGLAGNSGLPVAEPSSRDLEVAAQFVARLLEAKPTLVEPTKWARDFARHVRDRKRDGDVASLVLALRLHGDAWLIRFGREQEQLRQQMLESARLNHRTKHEGAWLAFVAETEQICRASKARRIRRFREEGRKRAMAIERRESESGASRRVSDALPVARFLALGCRV